MTNELTFRMAAGLFALMALAGSTACASAKAETPVERPALNVPPPPPRVVVPLPPPQQPLEPVENLGPGVPVLTPRPRPQRDNNKEAPKQEAKPEEPKPAEPAPQPPAVAAPPQLRIPETTNTAQLATQIQESIWRSRAILGNVHYAPLSKVSKKAYEDSKLFAQQAEDALKANQLVFAKELADKAERLAKELQGR